MFVCFIIALVRRGGCGRARLWKALGSYPVPIPPLPQAVPPRSGRATHPCAGSEPGGIGLQAGAINSPIVHIYRAGWSPPPASRSPRTGRAGPGSAASRRKGQSTARAVVRKDQGVVAAEDHQPRASSEFVAGVEVREPGHPLPSQEGEPRCVVRGCSGTRGEFNQSR